ncbi:unnamed protein product [Adineta steineri]|uniref:FAS1 domain-containing protein n=1 Tax=Adineta steineri TaxID=433720 RepID=A0A819BXT0_9BILA|nr:unnamed protein product [Adineta steineri]CAF0991358.1 unnamed protein product [Adineta steineri]CAF1465669.1 unnamed protein product [Adineta steineri]CAF3809509.1 unnamed protein product [Adineta steineri]CAF3855928.1 unnamed protein product [Adineta steineri]
MVFTIFLVLIAGFLLQASLIKIFVSFSAEVVDIYDTVVTGGSFTILGAAIRASNLVATLKIGDPLTVFAPTDAAFTKLPPQVYNALFLPENRKKLIKILEYHIVVGNLTAEAIVALNPPINIETLAGPDVAVTQNEGKLNVNNATVIAPDIFATNGIIHAIDTVLFPPQGLFDIVDSLINNGNFDILVEALQAATLDIILKSTGPYTLFAPTDTAFRKLPPKLLIDLLLPENIQNLTLVLKYHALVGNLTAAAIIALNPPVDIITFAILTVKITQDGRKLKVNNATVIVSDVLAANGVIHVIDTVLLPPQFYQNRQYDSVANKGRQFH